MAWRGGGNWIEGTDHVSVSWLLLHWVCYVAHTTSARPTAAQYTTFLSVYLGKRAKIN